MINQVIHKIGELRKNEEDMLTFRATNISSALIVTPFVASYAQEEGLNSQAAFLDIATDARTRMGYVPGGLVEHSSTRISRVVRSTMAAESAALAAAVDRHMYCRLLWQHINPHIHLKSPFNKKVIF